MYKNKILVIGSSPFGNNAHDFFKLFKVNVLFYDINYRNKLIKLIKFPRYLKMLIRVDAVYTIGYFSPHSPLYLTARFLRKRIVVHWIGSEVLNLKRSHYWPIQGSFSVSYNLVSELERNNVHSSWLPLFFPLNNQIILDHIEFPETHGVLFYLVDNEEEFYGLKYLIFLANKFENINFHLIGSSKMLFTNKNIINMGYLNDELLNDLFNKITIYIRITLHDGLSQLMLKSLSLGKLVITNTDHPFVLKFDPLTNTNDDLALMMEQIFNLEPRANQDAIDYINEFYNHSSQFDRYYNAFIKIGIQL